MRYTIRHFDLPLLTFEANMDSADTGLHFIKVYEENRSFLPLNLTVSEDGVEHWLRHRTIPKNRAYVDALLSKVGLSLNRPLGIIAANKGLSLNDCFWVDAEGSGDTFEKVNLYDNRFSQVLAAIAFTGYGSSIRTSLASCPEFSTNGMLPKCWRRQNGKTYLYKGGTSGFSNLGFEPYSELYAYQVAQVMGVNAIRYTLTKELNKTLCSKCELFTSKEYSYIPIGQLVSKGGIKAILAYYQTLGQNFVDALEDMLAFDAIICNTDRHYGNFGVLVDNKTNTIAAPAPLFDHLQRKNAAAQEVNVPSCISCYLGVTEPAMFGVNLKFHFPFICGMIGSAIAAVVCVATSTTANAIGVGGIPGILSIQPAYMLSFALCMAIAIVVPFVLTVIVGRKKGVA